MRNDVEDGLPLVRGAACRLTRSDATELGECAAELRGKTEDARRLKEVLAGDGVGPGRWLRAQAVPALAQMLMAGPAPVREVLLGQLSRIEGKRASEALARLALFDQRSDVGRAQDSLSTKNALLDTIKSCGTQSRNMKLGVERVVRGRDERAWAEQAGLADDDAGA